ncbi:PAS domain-containing protein [Sphingomonas sp.]|uniref:PAS domain-containing protein n=1 Tax=Sphingomonas sp. TaxID=28214 RepID=UPI00286E196C|nr:PAS domain-containing protein [Sphingomonas sp.]
MVDRRNLRAGHGFNCSMRDSDQNDPMLAPDEADHYVSVALEAAERGDCHAVLDALPIPVYMTDVTGAVTYWNQACVKFAGREPQLGHDRWCVTWRLYTMSGEFLPHEACPMAEAIRRRAPIRNEIAIAERPDGGRVAFRPHPTPLFDVAGRFTGAVNMLIDVTAEQCGALADQASRCRRLAQATNDREASEILSAMAKGYEQSAETLKALR